MNLKSNLSIAVFSCLFLTGCTSNAATSLPLETPLSDNVGESAYALPESLDDIEDRTENIVRVEMQNIYHLGELDPEKDEYQWTLTVSEVEVLDVIEGDLEAGDTIFVGEPYYLSHGEDLQRIGGYVPMISGQDYLLFLSTLREETWLEEPVDSWEIVFSGYGQHHPDKEADFYDDLHSRNTKGFETVSDILDYDFMATRADEVELYRTIRAEIEEQYFYIFD